MVIKKYFAFFIISSSILLTSCNTGSVIEQKCPNAIIEWVDLLKLNDVTYEHHFPDADQKDESPSIQTGKKLGSVTFTMSDQACSDHVMKNGDAAYLDKGTDIYELQGYPSTFAVVADNHIYIADRNDHAKTAGELYPFKGLLRDIYIESTEDGSRLYKFSEASKEDFIKQWYSLKLKDSYTLNEEQKFEGKRVFLEFELNNGASFRELYWADTNTFQSGVIGNDKIQESLMKNY